MIKLKKVNSVPYMTAQPARLIPRLIPRKRLSPQNEPAQLPSSLVDKVHVYVIQKADKTPKLQSVI